MGKKSDFNLTNANTQTLTNRKDMGSSWTAGQNSGTSTGMNWGSNASSSSDGFMSLSPVDAPEYLQYHSSFGANQSSSTGGFMNTNTGAYSNQGGSQGAFSQNTQSASNVNSVSGGASESGSSYKKAGEQGYSKKSDFNLTNANTQTLTNRKDMGSNWTANQNSGT